MLKKLSALVAALTLAVAASGAQEQPTPSKKVVKVSGYLIDSACAAEIEEGEEAVEEAANHRVSCALLPERVKGGFVVVSAEGGKRYKLDAKGNKAALQLLKDTRVRQGMHVKAEGVLEGETLRVERITGGY